MSNINFTTSKTTTVFDLKKIIKNCFTAILFAAVFTCVEKIHAQSILVVPNPENVSVFDGVDVTQLPVILGNNLYVSYKQNLNNYYLAKYNGTDLSIIPNQSSSSTLYTQPAILNNKLYLETTGDSSIILKVYDGTNLTEINDPYGSITDESTTPVAYKNRLYFIDYVFDGTSFTKNIEGESFIIYNNNLVYSDVGPNMAYNGEITSYNGTAIIHYPNPNAGLFYSNYANPPDLPIEYNSQLYFNYASPSSGVLFAKFDGNKVSVVPLAGGYYAGSPFVSNSQLFIFYQKNVDSISQLTKYDGNNLTIISNPDDSGHYSITDYHPFYAYNYEANYQNKTYLKYTEPSGVTYLAEYDGNKVTLFANPDSGTGFEGALFVYNDKLYVGYSPAKGPSTIAQFDGNKITLLPAPNGISIGSGFANPIVYNNKLYFVFGNHLAYLDETALAVNLLKFDAQLNNNNAILNWQTASETNTSYFNIQRSSDGVHFTTMNRLTAAGNSASKKNYTYTDANVAALRIDKLYYRLQIIDKDGKSNYSGVKVIDFAKNKPLFSISPNPAKDYVNITSSATVSNAQIIITNVNGRTLYLSKHNFNNGEQLNVPVAAFANQTLFVTINASNSKQQFKVVKE